MKGVNVKKINGRSKLDSYNTDMLGVEYSLTGQGEEVMLSRQRVQERGRERRVRECYLYKPQREGIDRGIKKRLRCSVRYKDLETKLVTIINKIKLK